jgi:hypothetical protein
MIQFTKNLSQENWTGVKKILRYLKGTIDFALTCGGQGDRIGNQSSLSMWMQIGPLIICGKPRWWSKQILQKFRPLPDVV